MNMAVVFPDYDSAVELVKRLIDQGTTPQKITAIGQIVATDRPNPLAELLDGFGTLSLEEEKSLLVAGAWAPRVSVVSSKRLDGLFMEFGLPVQDLVQLEAMVRTGHYLVAVEDEAKEPIPRPEDGVLWAWPTSAVVH